MASARRIARLAAVWAGPLLAICHFGVATADERHADTVVDPLSVNALLKVLETRQNNTPSFEYRWDEAIFEPKSALLSSLSEQEVLKDEELRALAPLRDVHREQHATLIVDRMRIRFEQRGDRQVQGSEREDVRSVPFERIAVFDGSVSKDLIPQSTSKYPLGQIDNTNLTRGFDYIGTLPLVLAFRGGEWIRQWASDGGDPTALWGHVQEKKVVVLQGRPTGENRHCYTLSLSPTEGFSVLRIALTTNGRLIRQTDVSYEQHSAGQWIPIRWIVTSWWPDGNVRMQIDAVATMQIINPVVADATFDIAFPPGTYVSDHISKCEYIQRADGEKRLVSPQEWDAGVGYEQLLNSNPSTDITAPTRGRRPYWILAPPILLAAAACLRLVWRKRNRV